MKLFENVLISSDFDRTFTDMAGEIPARNLEAVAYFVENGGTFTLNSGRSFVTARERFQKIPLNAPIILYNGAATFYQDAFTNVHPIAADPWDVLGRLLAQFPDVNVEIHGLQEHFMVNPVPEDIALYERLGWPCRKLTWGEDFGNFLKFVVQAKRTPYDPEKDAYRQDKDPQYFEKIMAFIEKEMPEVDAFRIHPCFLDVQAKGVSKIGAAKELQTQLGKKILVCVGDGENDIPMLDGADFAYCPSDSVIKARYENVCTCGEGAVADVIYNKIPEIVRNGR